MSAFSLAATHPAHLVVGAAPDVRALVHVGVSGIGAGDVEASLRLWTPRGASVAVVRERAPALCDLRERAVRVDSRTIACAAGRWTDGAREYELVIALPPGRDGDAIRAARLTVIVDGEIAGRVPIPVTWTDDDSLVPTRRPDGRPPLTRSIGSELPTGRSPAPRHTLGLPPPVAPYCRSCELGGADGDRFCERCGTALGDAQKS